MNDARLERALSPACLRMPQWASGLALLTAVILAAPETVSLVAASAQELPKVTVRTVRGPGSEKKPASTARSAAAPRTRTRVAGSRTTYRRSERRTPTVAAASPRRRTRTAPRIAATTSQPTPAAQPKQTAAQVQTAAAPAPRRIRRRHRVRRQEGSPTRVAATEPLQGGAITLNSRAHRLQRRGRHEEAEPLLREALRKKPDYAYAQYNLGWSLVQQGKGKEAVLYLKRSSDAQPSRWEPLDKLAEAYEQAGDREKARETRRRVQELRGGRHRSTTRRKERERPTEEGAAQPAPPIRSAVGPGAWQQSTDRREEAWFQEKREAVAAPVAAPVSVTRD